MSFASTRPSTLRLALSELILRFRASAELMPPSEKDFTRCANGFNIIKGICEKIETNQEMEVKDHDKLMFLAITGVVLGSISIACIIIYFYGINT